MIRRRPASRNLADLDRLVLTSAALRSAADPVEVGTRVCMTAVDLARAAGAELHVPRAGGFVVLARHGLNPLGPDERRNADLASVLRGNAPVATDALLAPVPTAAGNVAVLTVVGARREVDQELISALTLLCHLAGSAVELLGTVSFDQAPLDPLTGVGTRQQGSSVIAELQPGDGLLVIELDDVAGARATGGDTAVQFAVGRLGLHLRNGTRPPGDVVARADEHGFVVLLRELKAPIHVIAGRLMDSWPHESVGQTISIGAALHVGTDTPLRVFEQAQSALASAREMGGKRALVAPS